jgi:hypothetical protein
MYIIISEERGNNPQEKEEQKMYCSMNHVHNSWGHGIYIRVDGYPEDGFYGYNKRSALKAYRDRYGLKGKHLIVHEW